MTLREHLAVHAPVEIPDWFVHVSPPKPEEPKFSDKLPHYILIDLRTQLKHPADLAWTDAEQWLTVSRNPRLEHLNTSFWQQQCDLSVESLRAIMDVFFTVAPIYWAAKEKWAEDDVKARLGQWPWAYADTVINHKPIK